MENTPPNPKETLHMLQLPSVHQCMVMFLLLLTMSMLGQTLLLHDYASMASHSTPQRLDSIGWVLLLM